MTSDWYLRVFNVYYTTTSVEIIVDTVAQYKVLVQYSKYDEPSATRTNAYLDHIRSTAVVVQYSISEKPTPKCQYNKM